MLDPIEKRPRPHVVLRLGARVILQKLPLVVKLYDSISCRVALVIPKVLDFSKNNIKNRTLSYFVCYKSGVQRRAVG